MKVKMVGACLTLATLCVSQDVLGGLIASTQVRTASFTSDLQNDVILTFDKFDRLADPNLFLQGVQVDIVHRGEVNLRADNDDDFKTASASGRMIRTWSLSGPDVVGFGTRTVLTPTVFLDVDNGDDSDFDPTPPDGTDFGMLVYSEAAPSIFPDKSLYEMDGPGTIDMTADVILMVNDLQFLQEPDVWQLEVQDPLLEVEVTLTYFIGVIPVPAGIWLGALGLGAVGWMKRRKLC